ncbi:hypothetical protein LGQ02_15930 [Bacillus shivajii]|uniref:hypothetical protein n=1 Tax=Bacillus shivajii TaxID=1983719 RepID=UPI001CF9FB8D|nr:hypothetical protein [Bacillus shivajii]UCZ52319.1 hypothetical protein LGQ02_15930 [Bacillus shivajii]
MQQVPLENLVHHVSPEWIHLLTEQERTQWIVLRNGIAQVDQTDLAEIMEAVIEENRASPFYQ